MVPAADPLEAHLHTEPGRYRVAMLAPPWIPVPPSGYGGIESVIALLCGALVTRGHRVTLYAAPGSRSCAEVVELLPRSFPEGIGRALYEVVGLTRFRGHPRSGAAPREDVHHGDHGQEAGPASSFVHRGVQGGDR